MLAGQKLRKECIEREETMRHGRCLCNREHPACFFIPPSLSLGYCQTWTEPSRLPMTGHLILSLE